MFLLDEQMYKIILCYVLVVLLFTFNQPSLHYSCENIKI